MFYSIRVCATASGHIAPCKGTAMPAQRTPISGPRQIGTIVDWKGAFGWVQPSKPINHPSAQKRGGKVYLAAEDVSEELDGIGASVSFTVYSDNNGLGAADCKMAKSAPKPANKASNGKPATSNAVASHKAAVSGKNAKGKGKGKLVAPTQTVQQTAWQKQPQQPKGGKQTGGKGTVASSPGGKQSGGKGKQSGGKGNTSRDTLHPKPLLGTIVQWKGKFGWVKPHDTIDHPMADQHQGDLYVSQEDVESEIEGVGSVVKFILYGDARGLGAQNVRPA